jgi:hypothetical protein
VEIRATDLYDTDVKSRPFSKLFHRVGRTWLGDLSADHFFDADAAWHLAPATLLYTVSYSAFSDSAVIRSLWDPGVFTTPNVSTPNLHRFCSRLPSTPEVVALALVGAGAGDRPGLYLYTAREQMPHLFRTVLEHCQMSDYTIENLNREYANVA